MNPVGNAFLGRPQPQPTQSNGGKRSHEEVFPLLDNAGEGLQEPLPKKPKLTANAPQAHLERASGLKSADAIVAKHQAFLGQFSWAIEIVKRVLEGVNNSIPQEELSMRFYNAYKELFSLEKQCTKLSSSPIIELPTSHQVLSSSEINKKHLQIEQALWLVAMAKQWQSIDKFKERAQHKLQTAYNLLSANVEYHNNEDIESVFDCLMAAKEIRSLLHKPYNGFKTMEYLVGVFPKRIEDSSIMAYFDFLSIITTTPRINIAKKSVNRAAEELKIAMLGHEVLTERSQQLIAFFMQMGQFLSNAQNRSREVPTTIQASTALQSPLAMNLQGISQQIMNYSHLTGEEATHGFLQICLRIEELLRSLAKLNPNQVSSAKVGVVRALFFLFMARSWRLLGEFGPQAQDRLLLASKAIVGAKIDYFDKCRTQKNILHIFDQLILDKGIRSYLNHLRPHDIPEVQKVLVSFTEKSKLDEIVAQIPDILNTANIHIPTATMHQAMDEIKSEMSVLYDFKSPQRVVAILRLFLGTPPLKESPVQTDRPRSNYNKEITTEFPDSPIAPPCDQAQSEQTMTIVSEVEEVTIENDVGSDKVNDTREILNAICEEMRALNGLTYSLDKIFQLIMKFGKLIESVSLPLSSHEMNLTQLQVMQAFQLFLAASKWLSLEEYAVFGERKLIEASHILSEMETDYFKQKNISYILDLYMAYNALYVFLKFPPFNIQEIQSVQTLLSPLLTKIETEIKMCNPMLFHLIPSTRAPSQNVISMLTQLPNAILNSDQLEPRGNLHKILSVLLAARTDAEKAALPFETESQAERARALDPRRPQIALNVDKKTPLTVLQSIPSAVSCIFFTQQKALYTGCLLAPNKGIGSLSNLTRGFICISGMGNVPFGKYVLHIMKQDRAMENGYFCGKLICEFTEAGLAYQIVKTKTTPSKALEATEANLNMLLECNEKYYRRGGQYELMDSHGQVRDLSNDVVGLQLPSILMKSGKVETHPVVLITTAMIKNLSMKTAKAIKSAIEKNAEAISNYPLAETVYSDRVVPVKISKVASTGPSKNINNAKNPMVQSLGMRGTPTPSTAPQLPPHFLNQTALPQMREQVNDGMQPTASSASATNSGFPSLPKMHTRMPPPVQRVIPPPPVHPTSFVVQKDPAASKSNDKTQS